VKTNNNIIASLIFRKIFPIVLILVITQSGCKKDIQPTMSGGVASMDQLKVAPDFNWKTTKPVMVSFNATLHGSVIIKSDSGTIYEKAMLFPGEPYESTITIPAFEQEVTLIYNGKTSVVKIVDGKITCTF